METRSDRNLIHRIVYNGVRTYKHAVYGIYKEIMML